MYAQTLRSGYFRLQNIAFASPDPADESIVYALASPSGVKGILVAGYGATTDEASTETLKRLHYKYHQSQQ